MPEARGDSASVLDALTSHLFLHATETDQVRNGASEEVTSAMVESVGVAVGDYYLDSNYGVTGPGTSSGAPAHVFICAGPTTAGVFHGQLKYGETAASLLAESNDGAIDADWFSGIDRMALFVRAVAYEHAGLRWDEPGLGHDAAAAEPAEEGQERSKPGNRAAVEGVFGEGATPSTAKASRAYKAVLAKTTEELGGSGGAASAAEAEALARFNGLRLWLAYQYIDHAPIESSGDYDSFLELQVRQLTKVVFVAKLLQSAAQSPDATPQVTEYFNRVLSLPYNDEAMLGAFLDPSNDSKHLDRMYNSNVETSARLYDVAKELEVKDAAMRKVQDNLRSLNTNDEMITAVRGRAHVAFVVVAVLTAALVAVLAYAFATGRAVMMYTTAGAVCLGVLLLEAARGVTRVLRLGV